jgi:MFS family permease
MKRFLVYLFPTMMDLMLSTVMFVVAVRFSESGASALVVVSIGAVWAVIYSLCSQVAGRLVTPRNAAAMICSASLLAGLIALGLIVFPSLKLQYMWIGLMGLATAFFFIPFMIFMKDMESGRSGGLARATALYTFSWSMGMASGPFIVGLIWGKFAPEYGWKYCYMLNILFSLVIAIGIWPIRKIVKAASKEHVDKEEVVENEYAKMPDLAWMGWLAAIGCFISVAILRTLFPYQASLLAIPKIHQGSILALASYSQAFTGLFLISSRFWMYKTVPVAIFGICGVIGLVLFGVGTVPITFYIGALIFGIYTGAFSFYLVFHSLVHPEHSARYLSVNETIVGITGMISPVIGGLVAGSVNVGMPYFACGVLVMLIIIIKVIVSRRMNVMSEM